MDLILVFDKTLVVILSLYFFLLHLVRIFPSEVIYSKFTHHFNPKSIQLLLKIVTALCLPFLSVFLELVLFPKL